MAIETACKVLPWPTKGMAADTARPRVGIIGAGVAGSTVALRLSQLGYLDVVLMEQGPTLVNGPPICHLHAGGNLYREISDEQCLALLKQSIDTLKLYPYAANIRPTVIGVPKRDSGSVEEMLPRLDRLQTAYSELVAEDPENQVLGPVEDYFRLFSEEQMRELAKLPLPEKPVSPDDWMVPVAKNLDFDQVKFPLVQVPEYGLSLFRLAATAHLALDSAEQCEVMTQTKVEQVERRGEGWVIHYSRFMGITGQLEVDYLINACGYRTGYVDDMIDVNRERMVEFKAAYVAEWGGGGVWPEVIFHGERGTPYGMAQLTPYADGLFQIHGMTEDITLFKDGLVSSEEISAQPRLSHRFRCKLDKGWSKEVIKVRTQNAIEHVAHFLPDFSHAYGAGKPLFGAQQIPGEDPDLRAADVSFDSNRYARTEIVKASSALAAADAIAASLAEEGFVKGDLPPITSALTRDLSPLQIQTLAEELAIERGYPASLAKVFGQV